MSNSEIVQELINLTIHDLKIIGKNGEIYQIYPDASKFSYVSMELLEGMFEASIVGKLIIRDINSTAEQIHFSGFEDIVIKVENPEIPNSYKSLRYKIYNVKASEDQIKNNKLNENANISSVKLEIHFVSYEHYLLSYKEFSELTGSTGADIITKIASKDSDNNVGLVNAINNNFFKTGNKQQGTTQKPMFIEPTYNWVWYKQNQSLYPWGKLNRPVKATQLLQYLAENSVAETNQYACNYLFWQDIDRWNFRSVESLLKEKTDKKYFASTVPTKTGNILQLQIINESNYLRLFESNAFSAKYYLVEPKWNHPYREILDYNESHSIKEITFDYFKDYNKWLKVEKYPLLESNVDTKPTVVNVINDNISGYFSPSYSNRDKTVEWDHYGYTFSNRDGFETWQPMFDQTELDGEVCKIIQKEIKQKIKDKKIEYANKKNLKEKWKLYRCSICCDTRYRDPTEQLENEPVFTPEYGVVAAGSFSDMVNFDISDGFTADRQFPVGLTLSYDFSTDPYNKTIGDLFHLVDVPTLQTKYLYDLEEKRVDIARELLQKSLTRILKIREELQRTKQKGLFDEFFYNSNDPDSRDDARNPVYTQEVYLETLNSLDNAVKNRQDFLNSNYFTNLKNTIRQEKENFLEVYEKFKNRKAFFISKELGFTADNSKLNLFNIKSIKRIPIRGSKYEKLAKKTVVSEWINSLTQEEVLTSDFLFKGFPQGITSYYPYLIFYDNDDSIDPSTKHAYYDLVHNLNIGYNSNSAFSAFDSSGGPHSGSPQDRDPNTFLKYFSSRYVNINIEFFGRSVASFGDQASLIETCQQRPGDVISSKSGNFNVKKTIIKQSNDPYKLTQTEFIKSVVQDIAKSISPEPNNPLYLQEYLRFQNQIEITDNSVSIEQINDLQSWAPPCGNDRRFIKYTITIEKNNTNNNGNAFLSQIDPSICVLEPFGLERISDFNPIDYLNSRNFIDVETNSENEIKKPTENILEEIESFVRIEFQVPVGVNTLYDFPQGFYDTPGSEYYLPYNVLITPGPFGTKSVDYNISVIGQDPYGFDVAVKRIKKKKQELKPQEKALVNFKDSHILESGYSKPTNGELVFKNTNTPSYGYVPSLQYESELVNNTVDSTIFVGNEFDFSRAPTPWNSSILNNRWVSGRLNEFNSGDFYYNGYNNANVFYNFYDEDLSFSLNDARTNDSDNKRKIKDKTNNINLNSSNLITKSIPISEVMEYDVVNRSTRKNPLSIAQSYYELNNIRPLGIYFKEINMYQSDWWEIYNYPRADNVGQEIIPNRFLSITDILERQYPSSMGGGFEEDLATTQCVEIINDVDYLDPGYIDYSFFGGRSYHDDVCRRTRDKTGSYYPYLQEWFVSPTDYYYNGAIKTKRYYEDIARLPFPSNVIPYFYPISFSPEEVPTFPIDQQYFKSITPVQGNYGAWFSIAETHLKNRNERIEPEDEQSFYGYFYGCSVWEADLADDLEKSVWKNDYTGETEYGLVAPELNEEFSVFDRNFAAQFIVMTRQSLDIEGPCAGYNCSNPNLVNNASCPDDNPLCNCPCQELRPDKLLIGVTGSEPTYKELKDLEKEIKECTLIEEKLGQDWLGCAWNDPKNPLNCNCPCIGERYMDYLRYSQTYCTFWQTPPERPLLRNAQMMQLLSSKIVIKLNGDLTLRPGNVVTLELGDKRYSGRWLVSSILHDFAKTKHLMDVTLIRDTEYKDPNKKAKKLILNTE